ncbi:hypothetical protein KKA15_00010 [Patescibacteria group bacterium]|nr:hypothetical protein [Patescibacteria group bacterium]
MKRNEAGLMFANVHLLVGYNQASLTDLREMADVLRETFPQATDEEIQYGKVFESSMVQGFTIITWASHIPEAEYPGWTQFKDGRMDYYW